MDETVGIFVADGNLEMLEMMWKLITACGQQDLMNTINSNLEWLASSNGLGTVATFQELMEKYDEKLYNEIPGSPKKKLKHFIRHCDLTRMRFCLSNTNLSRKDWQNALYEAARQGNVPLIEYFVSKGINIKYNSRMCKSAARGGHIDTIIWLRKQGCVWSDDICAYTARGGHLKCLQWLVLQRGRKMNETTFAYAARGGHIHILEWLKEYRCELDLSTSSHAARKGHIHVLEWLLSHYRVLGDDICTDAAFGGHLHVLQWLKDNGYEYKEDVCSIACNTCNLELLKWAIGNGCELAHCAFDARTEIVEYLKSIGIDFEDLPELDEYSD